MKSKTIWLFTTSLLIFSCLNVMARTTPPPKTKSAPDGCEQFTGIVVEPDKTTDQKMRDIKPNDAERSTGVVVNPCKKQTVVRIKPLMGKPHFNSAGQSPKSESQNQSAIGRVKPITKMVNSSEMLNRARQAKEQGKQ